VNAILEEESETFRTTRVATVLDDMAHKSVSATTGGAVTVLFSHWPGQRARTIGPSHCGHPPRSGTVSSRNADNPDQFLVDMLALLVNRRHHRKFRNSVVFVVADNRSG